MATRAETRQIRLAQWRKILAEKASSGLTAKEFCAQNNISRDSYFYWQNLVREDALTKMKPPALVELKPPATIDDLELNTSNPSASEFKPQIAVTINNATIQIDANTPKELLALVLEVVSNAK
ncbi:MAG: hypothetical protein K6E27_09170 [Eubacterium sp.]|nr:hypothetical protein [Eubacterium sp.]